MTQSNPPGPRRAERFAASRRAAPADVIADPGVRECYDRLAAMASGIHPGVSVSDGGVELRVEFAGRLLCRLVPYRELVHVLIGDHPSWETRLRGPEAFHDAADQLVNTFLRMAADTGSPPPAAATGR